ncbi:MAG: efflux RND transporter periplasmic adaptor subunit [Candidatus Delongbacteria bacterium]
MKTRIISLNLALLALLALAQSCGKPAAEPAHEEVAVVEEDHEGHGHAAEGEAELSDLDRPVDELFAATCEHEMNTYKCAECRYEVGVVHTPPQLFQEGLLKLGKVERRVVDLPLTLMGEVVFDEGRVTHLSPVTAGIIRQVHVTLGQRVRRGQLLLELESAEAGEAQERQLEAEAQVARATRDFERASELRDQGINSEKEFLQARQEQESARIRLNTAQSRLASMGLSAQDPPGRVLVRAPEDGTVLTLHAVPGESVHPEESLVTVGDNRVLWVWCDLYERDIAGLLSGPQPARRPARVTVKAWPQESFTGSVEFISPSMDVASRTAKVRVAVQNKDQRLLAGMFAQVQVYLPGSENVQAVPAAAVCEDEGRSFVFVPHGADYFVRRPVVTGRAWADWVELVQPTDLSTVVADGVFLLKSDVLRSKMGAGCAD